EGESGSARNSSRPRETFTAPAILPLFSTFSASRTSTIRVLPCATMSRGLRWRDPRHCRIGGIHHLLQVCRHVSSSYASDRHRVPVADRTAQNLARRSWRDRTARSLLNHFDPKRTLTAIAPAPSGLQV